MKSLLKLMMLAALPLFFYSCSDSDDDDKTQGSSPSSQYNQSEKKLLEELKSHKWNSSYFDVMLNRMAFEKGYGSAYFLNDSIGLVTGVDKTFYLKDGKWTRNPYENGFKYTINGNKVTLYFYDDGWIKNEYTYENGELRESSNYAMSPAELTDNDREYMAKVAPIQGTSGNVNYYLDITTSTLKIYGKGKMADYKEKGQPWAGKYFTQVQVGEGVTTIGSYSFSSFDYLTDIKLPSTLTAINKSAFALTRIRKVDLPANVTTVGEAAFYCDYLETLNFPSNSKLQVIEMNAFSAPIGQYQTLVLPDNVTTIGGGAFERTLYKGVKLNEKLETIGKHAFGDGTKNTYTEPIVIPNSVKSIGNAAFYGRYKEVYIGSGVEKLGGGAFASGEWLTVKVNRKTPPVVDGSAPVLSENGTGTLVVPVGCKSVYANTNGWKNFYSIREDSSLDGGSGSVSNSSIIEITGISFCNTDYDGNTIDDYGAKLYDGRIKYIGAEISYNGLTSTSKDVTFYVKVIKEDGSLIKGTSSPEGYSFDIERTVKSGKNLSLYLVGYGSNSGGTYKPGQYTYEIWLDGAKIYQASFTVYKSDGNNETEDNSKLCPDSNHPHMIDLGLPSGTLWACCNVGANRPEDYGGYYAWGETKTKSTYDWSTYVHCDGTSDTCHDLGSNIAGTSYDAATANWGAPWKMPTLDQCEELEEKTTSVWTTQNGVKGRLFTGSNGCCIFLPAAGVRWHDELQHAGSDGFFFSSSLYESNPYFARFLYFYSGTVITMTYERYLGMSVRPVRKN